jgi:uncharacterized protein
MKNLLFSIIITLIIPTVLFSQTKKETNQNSDSKNIFSRSYNYVNDFEKILNPKQITTLNNTLKSFETKALYKIIVVSTSSIKPYNTFPEYAAGLDQYLASDPKLDPTILIMISKELRQIQIQSIDLIRYKLSDDETQNIIATFAVPEFKNGDYYTGLEKAINQIITKLQ